MLSDITKQAINNLPALLSMQETADLFLTSYLTVNRLVKTKKLEAYKDNEGNWCIPRYAIKNFCSKNCNL